MIEPPDSHYLSAAIGWLGLGNCQEALLEVEHISAENREHPSVLQVRYDIAFTSRNWTEAAVIAGNIRDLAPDDWGAWVGLAYAVRRKTDGGIAEARKILDEAARKFPDAWLIAYNLACYDCQLGDLDSARNLLVKAEKLGNPAQVRKMAQEDPDLEPLRSARNTA